MNNIEKIARSAQLIRQQIRGFAQARAKRSVAEVVKRTGKTSLTRAERIAKRAKFRQTQAPARARAEMGARAESQRVQRLARRGKQARPARFGPAPKPAAAPKPALGSRIARIAKPVAIGAGAFGAGYAGAKALKGRRKQPAMAGRY